VVIADFILNWQFRVALDANLQAYDDAQAVWSNFGAGRVSYETLVRAGEKVDATYHSVNALETTVDVIRIVMALVILAAYLALARGDRCSVGLLLMPTPAWRYWATTGVFVGLLVTAVLLPLAVAWRLLEWRLDHILKGGLLQFWVSAPLLEEIIYRGAVCTPIAARWGARPAIVVSGILFGLIHVVYDSANPINLLAGFFLAWTFLKSNSILVPMLFHAGGNVMFFYLATALLPR
jgi:membrane protease YdiL (CAAX protease family)